MPRMKLIYDYNTEDEYHRPHTAIIDVPYNDSVNSIIVEFTGQDKPLGFVQIDKTSDVWGVTTSFDVRSKNKKEKK